MGSSKSPTPERELLRLIEEDKNTGGASSIHRPKLGGMFSLSVVRARFSFLKSNIFNTFRPQEFSITSLNKLLGIIFLFLFFYAAVDIASSMLNLKGKVAAAFKMAKKPSFYSQRGVSTLKELKYYQNKAKNRDIFDIVMAKKQEPLKKTNNIQEIIKKTSYLKLVGISWSNNPDAMIEDTRAKKTLFVKEGDLIDNILVRKILRDKVILNLEGEAIELK